jgi:hypothetical protein
VSGKRGDLRILRAQHAAPEPLQADSAPEEAVLRDRADWTMFRNPETLGQRAGVPRHRLPQAVAKEVADNALDHLERLRLGAGHCRLGLLEDGFFVENYGPGLPGGGTTTSHLSSPSTGPTAPASCCARSRAACWATACAWWPARCCAAARGATSWSRRGGGACAGGDERRVVHAVRAS